MCAKDPENKKIYLENVTKTARRLSEGNFRQVWLGELNGVKIAVKHLPKEAPESKDSKNAIEEEGIKMK